ncbi:facilitated trehalose transporter Tret1-2 homolog isoform X2 [Panulirus ornatus]|uniref:facilitated trehalose transporter Tret1-2 homolog isoform X2 n=1 Tax=Panulirus ornatus TaxID=150431 RepID=UPI003A8AE59B
MFLGVSVSHIAQLGMVLAWPNALASDLVDDNTTIFASQLHFPDWQLDMMGSLVFLGSLPGYITAGWLVRNLGRRRSLVLSTFPGFLGWILIALAYNTNMIIGGRFFTGMAMALATVSCRTYLVEIADTEIRGTAGMIASSMLEFGGILTISLGMVLPWYSLAFLVVALLLFYCLVIMPFLPESPTYLAVQNRSEEALQVLLQLRGRHVNLDEELSLLKQQNDRVEVQGWSALLKPFILKRMVVCIGILCISNFCGTEVIRANATRMLQASGLAFNRDVSTIMTFVLSLCGNLTMMVTIDRLGRRRCLVLSLSLLTVVYTALGVILHFTETPALDQAILKQVGPPVLGTDGSPIIYQRWSVAEWLRLVCLLLAPLGISLGAGPIPWVVSPEFFPTTIRSQAMSVCSIAGCIMAFVPLQLYSAMQATLTQAGLYWTYATVSGLGILFTMTCVPETSGRKIW